MDLGSPPAPNEPCVPGSTNGLQRLPSRAPATIIAATNKSPAASQSMRGQYRKGPATRRTEVALDTLLFIPLLLLFLGCRLRAVSPRSIGGSACHAGVGGIRVTFVSPMQVHAPRTTVGALRTLSSELIFSKLHRRGFSHSLTPIKSLSFGLHEAIAPSRFTTVPLPRLPPSSQHYSTESRLGPSRCRGLVTEPTVFRAVSQSSDP